MRPLKFQLLLDNIFLSGLFILLINDLFLKYWVGGFITGKLSDVAGLFVFPFFWSVFFERQKLPIYVFTLTSFVLWKLPLFDNVIVCVNLLIGANLQRTIDYGDLVALLILPISYRYFSYKQSCNAVSPIQNGWVVSATISFISLFSFVATTVPKQEVKQKLNTTQELICNVNKDEIFRNRITPGTELSNNLSRNITDSLFLISFDLPEYNSQIESWVEIYSFDSSRTLFKLDSLHTITIHGKLIFGIDKRNVDRMNSLSENDLKNIFKSRVIEPIERNQSKEIYFNNPKLEPGRW